MSRISKGPQQDGGDAVAKVDGDVIAREDLEQPLSQRIYKLENKIYKLKRDRLEQLIQEALLDKESKRRGISRERLRDDILNGGPEISDEEVEHYCRENPSQLDTWEGSQKAFKDRVRKVLARKKSRETISAFAEGLKNKYAVETFLKKPSLPLTQVDIEGRPALGPADAPVVVVEFSDPFCPACRSVHETTQQIRKAYGDRIRWVFKDFPLEILVLEIFQLFPVPFS